MGKDVTISEKSCERLSHLTEITNIKDENELISFSIELAETLINDVNNGCLISVTKPNGEIEAIHLMV